MAGVARLGHGMVREIYSLNDATPVMGLRNFMRHTSTGRPHEMPLTEDWLVDFSRFFKIGASEPQKARAIGPACRARRSPARAEGRRGRSRPMVSSCAICWPVRAVELRSVCVDDRPAESEGCAVA